jgi:hypothetical protein
LALPSIWNGENCLVLFLQPLGISVCCLLAVISLITKDAPASGMSKVFTSTSHNAVIRCARYISLGLWINFYIVTHELLWNLSNVQSGVSKCFHILQQTNHYNYYLLIQIPYMIIVLTLSLMFIGEW